MGNKVKGFSVVLRQDIDEEHADRIKAAIEMIGGVLKVDSSVTEVDDWMNRERIRFELSGEIWAVLHPKAK